MKTCECIVHIDDSNATYRDVTIPDCCPVTLNFSPEDVIGRARLYPFQEQQHPAFPDGKCPSGVYAEIIFAEELFNLPDPPTAVCSLVDSRRVFNEKDMTAYLVGGYVASVAVLTEDAEAMVFDGVAE